LKLAWPLQEQVTQDEDRPAFADDIERASQRAIQSVTVGSALPAEYQGTVVFALRANRDEERLRRRIDLAGNDGMLVRLD
jgi:hypothetical protein